MSIGKVYLIGAGPGDPGLITVKGLRCLQEAEVVVYDRLVNVGLLLQARPDAELIYVGKWPRRHALKQEEINQLLVNKAKEDKIVARLKGGDPFVFGRGGEEAQTLFHAGVLFEIVPGITSAIAAPAYAGIPITHRSVATSFTVVSGSEDPSKEKSAIDWRSLASGAGTLVVLMGWESLGNIILALMKHGQSPSKPVALVHWGTEPYQRTVVGTLGDILARAKEAGLQPPVVAVVGEVVRLRDEIKWFDNRPLFGKRVLVTRTRTQASTLSALLAREGAEPVELPTIEIRPVTNSVRLDKAIANLSRYQWVVFTSANGVDVFFHRLSQAGFDARALGQAKLAALGPATAEALHARGLVADCVPREYVSEALVDSFAGIDVRGARVLLPRASGARDVVVDGLRKLGATVDDIPTYRAAVPKGSRSLARQVLDRGNIDAVTFTSSSTVRHLMALFNGNKKALVNATVACIGPVTAQTARELDMHVDVVAKEHTIPGLVQAIKEYYGGREQDGGLSST